MLASISQSVIALVDKLKQRYVVFELCNRQKGNEPRHKGAASVSHRNAPSHGQIFVF